MGFLSLLSAAVCVMGCLTLAFGEPAPTTAPAGPAHPIHILPLGDSITQGGRNDRPEFTYRLPLFHKLVDAGVNFQFVGSLTKGLHADATWPDYHGRPFDPHHEGHYGWKTAAVRDHLGEWMKTYTAAPDIVLIHLGTNDQGSKDFDHDIVQPLSDMIAMLRRANPRVVVLVGHLNFKEGKAVEIRPLVEAMAKKLDTEQSPVRTVNHFEGFNAAPDKPDSDTFDWAHPNPAGQEKMAAKWFEAMSPFLARFSSAAPTTSPAVR